MEDIFDQFHWDKLVAGYTFYDCTILEENRLGFVLIEEDAEPDVQPNVRFLSMGIDNPINARFACTTSGNFGYTTISSSKNPREYLAVDTESNVFTIDAKRMGEEEAIEDVIDMSTYEDEVGIIEKVVRVCGQVYALGDYRKIYRRIGTDKWIELGSENKGVPMPAEIIDPEIGSEPFGFRDMSAFSPSDIYAVGGAGDVWRFDGEQWHNCPFPTNADLQTVCCAGDGFVYITELNGSVWAGRVDHWKMVAEANFTAGFEPVDAFWFKSRLYLGAQQGIFTVDTKQKRVIPLKDVEDDAPNPTNGGRLDLSHDERFLLTVGPYGACLNDGSGWRRLFSAFDFT